MEKFWSGQLLNNLLNPFSEKERESTANCSMWTQWVRQQSTTAMLQKSLDRLNFSTDPRFSFFTRLRFNSSFFHPTSCIAFLFCGSNCPIPISRFTCLCSNCSIMSRLCYNVQIISLYQYSISDEEHFAPTPPLANHCSRLLRTCPLNVFHWFSILHFHSS